MLVLPDYASKRARKIDKGLPAEEKETLLSFEETEIA